MQLLIFLFVVDTYHSLTTKEEFENTKGVIRIRKSKKNRQHNGQKKKDTNRTEKSGVNSDAPEG